MGWTRSQQLGTSHSLKGAEIATRGGVGNTSSKTTPKATEVAHDAQAREHMERIATRHRCPQTQGHADNTHTHKPDHDYIWLQTLCTNLWKFVRQFVRQFVLLYSICSKILFRWPKWNPFRCQERQQGNVTQEQSCSGTGWDESISFVFF